MGRLTKIQADRHRQACELVALDRDLTLPEREFVLDNFHEAEAPTHGLDGAYFTPTGLARHLDMFHVFGERVLDLGAGIGRLAYHFYDHWTCDWANRNRWHDGQRPEIVCVEKNPDYVRVGRKVLPEATWVQADVFDVPEMDWGGEFSDVISNPPFGVVDRGGRHGPRYRGRRFEYHVIDIAAAVADRGAFIIPQQSAPFRYSGVNQHRWERDEECQRFEAVTGIELMFNVGIDTTDYDREWHGVSPRVEIVCMNLPEQRLQQKQRLSQQDLHRREQQLHALEQQATQPALFTAPSN